MIKLHFFKSENIQSFLYAYIVCISFVNYAVSRLFGISALLIHMGVFGLFFVYKLPSIKQMKLHPICFLYVALIFFIFFSTENSDMGLFRFAFNVAVPLAIGLFAINTEKFLRYVTYASLVMLILIVPIFNELNRLSLDEASVMGVSYAIIPVIIAGFLHFVYYRKHSNRILKFCYLIDLLFVALVFLNSNRGVALTLFIALLFVYIKNPKRINSSGNVTLRTIFVCIVAVVAYLYLYDILEFIGILLKRFNIEVDFISKTLRLKNAGNIDNGRGDITQYVMENISKSPIWGHGISTIYYNSGGKIIYPHNFILQLFYDGGIILAIPTLFVLCKATMNIFAERNKDQMVYLLFFAVVCIPKMMFSTDMWTNSIFWLFVASLFNHNKTLHSNQNNLNSKE